MASEHRLEFVAEWRQYPAPDTDMGPFKSDNLSVYVNGGFSFYKMACIKLSAMRYRLIFGERVA